MLDYMPNQRMEDRGRTTDILQLSSVVCPLSSDRTRDHLHPLSQTLLLVGALGMSLTGAATSDERRSEVVRYRDVQIQVIVEGQGPAVVLLPSLARDSEDYDTVAEGLSAAGFRVLRPKPRGIGRSVGSPLHDRRRRHPRPCVRAGPLRIVGGQARNIFAAKAGATARQIPAPVVCGDRAVAPSAPRPGVPGRARTRRLHQPG